MPDAGRLRERENKVGGGPERTSQNPQEEQTARQDSLQVHPGEFPEFVCGPSKLSCLRLRCREVLDNTVGVIKNALSACLIDRDRMVVGTEDGLFCVDLDRDGEIFQYDIRSE